MQLVSRNEMDRQNGLRTFLIEVWLAFDKLCYFFFSIFFLLFTLMFFCLSIACCSLLLPCVMVNKDYQCNGLLCHACIQRAPVQRDGEAACTDTCIVAIWQGQDLMRINICLHVASFIDLSIIDLRWSTWKCDSAFANTFVIVIKKMSYNSEYFHETFPLPFSQYRPLYTEWLADVDFGLYKAVVVCNHKPTLISAIILSSTEL